MTSRAADKELDEIVRERIEEAGGEVYNECRRGGEYELFARGIDKTTCQERLEDLFPIRSDLKDFDVADWSDGRVRVLVADMP